MIVDSELGTSTDPAPLEADRASGASIDAPGLQAFVTALFFIWGGITSLNDVIIPKLKALFTLSNAEVMLVNSAFFIGYFALSIPAVAVVQRLGYMKSAVAGLLMMTAGCLLFIPAASAGAFAAFFPALFVVAGGMTVLQVVANPLISLLGPARTAHSRLTLAQAFNSLGTTVFPYVGAILILRSSATVDPATLSGAALAAYRAQEGATVSRVYIGLAVVLALVAAVFWLQRGRLAERPAERRNPLAAFRLLREPRFAFGALSIFVYVGAEVAVGSLIVNFLEQRDVLALGAEAAGKRVPLYWGGAMVGRFVGAYLLRLVSPGKVLAGAAAGSLLLLFCAAQTTGAVSGWSLLAVGLCNSIMFPTIFALAIEGFDSGRAAEGSGVICAAIVGGAIIPPLTGKLADLTSLRGALVVPGLCYLLIVAFGLFARRPAAGAARTGVASVH